MANKGTVAKRLNEPTLTAADWIEGALQLIAETGLAALTIGKLAARLGVTKGSFYWHFKGRPELLAGALKRWENRGTAETIVRLSAVTDARQRLHRMLDAASQPPRARSLYAALAEAVEEPAVRRVLQRVASARIAYLEDCYRELGFGQAQAKNKAVFAYAAYRGLLQLAHEAPKVLPADWAAYLAVVVDALEPAAPANRRQSAEGPKRPRV